MGQKTWGGRFSKPTDKLVEQFTESISFDKRLYAQDIRASQAHAKMLAKVGLISEAEAKSICNTLNEIGKDLVAGKVEYKTALEDIHTHIESELIARIGDTGRKLHTARSRNDQVVTDVKLWVRDHIDEISIRLKNLQRAFVAFADRERDVVMPGYTHLQRAQPVLAAHYFLAYAEKFQRDLERLADCRERVNILPLGAAALAGTSLPIDRQFVAKELGFDRITQNSLDTSSDRDFAIEYLSCLSLIAIHLSNWAEEWILWTTTEFNAIILPDEFCTGSSIMPHKKNPDVLELTRGKTARVIGALNHMLMLMKGLPMAYNRDLQEDKLAIFDATDTIMANVEVAAALIDNTKMNRDSIAAKLDQGFLDATTLMELLIRQGMPMRTAHEEVGKLVRECEAKECRLVDLPSDRIDRVSPKHAGTIQKILGAHNAIAAFQSEGSTAPGLVKKQIDAWKKKLK